MKINNLVTATYFVAGFPGLSLTEALRLWKARFETIKHFKRDVITHPKLKELAMLVEEQWDNIIPITVQEALQEKNMEKRRMMFDCIGVSKLFNALQPELLDRQVIKKMRTRWDKNHQPYEYQFEDTYELYQLDGKKLFVPINEWNIPNPVFAVRCWCTTTGREYWIYVPEEVALGRPRWHRTAATPDAIRAIAWTIRLDVSNPKRIFRQGDIIVVEESGNSQAVTPYHLSKKEYVQLMFSET